jgi:protein-S-isoprenylcysteine O-methyltransferase Ste14
VGIILSYLAAPLILGSWWSFAVSGSIAMALIWRTVNEDATLQRELPGYRDFARRTPYRLLPGLW